MKSAAHIICVLALAFGCGPGLRAKGKDSRTQTTPAAKASTEPVITGRSFTAEEIAESKERGNDPLFSQCEPISEVGLTDFSVKEVRQQIEDHTHALSFAGQCTEVGDQPPWSPSHSTQKDFCVFEIIRITDFEALMKSSKPDDPRFSERVMFFNIADRWPALRAGLHDDDEIWTVKTSPQVWGLIVVRGDEPLCFVFVDHSY